jgi:hypothetical protein
VNRATPKLRQVAQRLLALEAAAGNTADAHASPTFRVCEKLRQSLSRFMGVAGFRSLLSRALALASDEVRWLKAVHVTADGSLEGLGELAGQLSQNEIAQGGALLIAQLIGLLLTFIGEALTVRLVQEAWPEISSGDLDF